MTVHSPIIHSLETISGNYTALLCDVWGVVHNGVEHFPQAVAALAEARARGVAVVMITNSPRLGADVVTQMRTIGVPNGTYDKLVSSGDVTRDLIAEAPRRIFHIGPDRDTNIYDGLNIELVEDFEAQAVVCTGPFDDETETPEDYRELLTRLRSRNLPFICANPDIVVERGDRLIWCAGAIARDYGQMGGRTLIAGKPHAPIYKAALSAAAEIVGRDLDRREVLAIGDGMMTDIKGAADNGVDALYISGGIHARDYGDALNPDPQRLAAFLEKNGYAPVAVMPRLQ